MGLKMYLRALKDEDARGRLRTHNVLNIMLFVMMMIVCFLSLQFESNRILAGVLGIVWVLMAVGFIISVRIMFSRLLKNIKNQTYENRKVDCAIRQYSEGYINFVENQSKTSVYLDWISRIYYLLCLTLSLLSSILILLGITILQKYIPIIYGVGFFLFVLLIILEMILNRKNSGIWETKFAEQKAIIDEHIANTEHKTYHQKYSILDDIKPVVQNKYLFPTKDIKAKEDKRVRFSKTMLPIYIILVVVVTIVVTIVDSVGVIKIPLFPINLGVILAVGIVWAIIDSVHKNINKKKQISILNENKEENAQTIELHRLRSNHDKKWNLIFALVAIILLLLPMTVGSTLIALKINVAIVDNITLVLVLAIPVGFIVLLVFWSKAFGRMRLRMREIEKNIDRKYSEQNVFAFNENI